MFTESDNKKFELKKKKGNLNGQASHVSPGAVPFLIRGTWPCALVQLLPKDWALSIGTAWPPRQKSG